MPFTVKKKHWAVEIKRVKRTEHDAMIEATVGIKRERLGLQKALELRLDLLRHWPFIRAGYTKGPLPLLDIDEQETRWALYLDRVEWDEAEKEETWVAPGESRSSWSGVVGHDQPYVWRRC